MDWLLTMADSDKADYGLYLRDRSASTMGISKERSPRERNLEITDIQTAVVGGNYDWVFVRVYTDSGITGTGEAYWGAGVAEAIHRLKELLIGENPLDIDRLFEHLVERTAGEGSSAGTMVTAISGVEIALHDIAGKVYELPVYALLGGKYRDSVRVYCDSHAGEHMTKATDERLDPTDIYTPDAYATAAESVVADGFDALKFDLDVPNGFEKNRANRHLRTPEIDHKVAIVEAVDEVLDDQVDVAYDCHWIFSESSATRLATAIEPYDVWWLEDTVPPENTAIQETMTHNTTTTIASGENRYRMEGFRDLITDEAVNIVQPDIPKVGGLREGRKIADLADLYAMPMAMHNVSAPIATMAAAHLASAIPNFLALEYHARHIPWWGELVQEEVIADGKIEVPETPGIGLTLDLDVVADHLIEGETLFDEV